MIVKGGGTWVSFLRKKKKGACCFIFHQKSAYAKAFNPNPWFYICQMSHINEVKRYKWRVVKWSEVGLELESYSLIWLNWVNNCVSFLFSTTLLFVVLLFNCGFALHCWYWLRSIWLFVVADPSSTRQSIAVSFFKRFQNKNQYLKIV